VIFVFKQQERPAFNPMRETGVTNGMIDVYPSPEEGLKI